MINYRLASTLSNSSSSGGGQSCSVRSLGLYNNLYGSLSAALNEANCNLDEQYPQDAENPEVKFDFIVIGAGSAGSVIANRLSARSEWSVLLLEAGVDPPVESDIPAFSSSLIRSPYDWNYLTESSPFSCAAMNNGQCQWPRGRMLGGSSSMNGMLYVRGHPTDYDGWASSGNKGWRYNELYRLFKKLENFTDVETGLSTDHGYDGYLHLEPFKERVLNVPRKMRKLIIRAAQDVGIPFVKDVNANQTVCVTTVPGTVRDGKRNNLAKAYLSSVRRNRPNLTVVKNATVTKILINELDRSSNLRNILQ